MIRFFQTPQKSVIATEIDHALSEQEIKELTWLYGEATLLDADQLDGFFVGPRREMVTPWSTNAVEITQNMGLKGISRIEEYFPVASEDADHDPMLQRMYRPQGHQPHRGIFPRSQRGCRPRPHAAAHVQRPQPEHLHHQHQAGAHQVCGQSGGVQREGRSGPEP